MPKDEAAALTLSAGKFAAPRPDPRNQLARPRLLERLRKQLPGRRLFVFDAQPGQGKSIAAAQLLADVAADAVWYRLDHPDGTPLRIVLNLYRQLQQRLPGLALAALEQPLPQPPDEDDACLALADQLIDGLAGQPGEQALFVVFDQLERIAERAASVELIAHLARNAPHRLKLLLLGRTIPLPIAAALPADSSLWLHNAELAFRDDEIRALYETVQQRHYPACLARLLHDHTGGWITGILHLLEAMDHTIAAQPTGELAQWARLQRAKLTLADYYRRHVLAHLSTEQIRLLAALAWLDPIEPCLAAHALGLDRAERALQQLCGTNLFLYRRPGVAASFEFDPLFRDFLRHESVSILGPAAQLPILTRAAGWAAERGWIEDAVRYAVNGGALEQANALIGAHPELLLRAGTLLEPAVLDETLTGLEPAQQPWFALLAATALLESDPTRALPLLPGIQDAFASRGEAVGELAALAQQAWASCLTDGAWLAAKPLQGRIHALWQAIDTALPPAVELLANLALASSQVLYGISLRAYDYDEAALQLAQELEAANQETILRVIRSFSHIFLGDFMKAGAEVEHLQVQLSNPTITPLNRLLIYAVCCNLSICYGAHGSFLRNAAKLVAADKRQLASKTQVGPLLYRWRADNALAQGDIGSVLDHAETGLALGHAGFRPHLRSQLLQYRAYAHALRGAGDKARADADQALALRARAGGHHFLIHSRILLGATYALLDEAQQAEAALTEAIAIGRQADAPYPLAGAHAYRCWLLLSLGRKKAATADCAAFLALMKHNEYQRCFGWTPAVIQPVLEFSVRQNIERPFAQQLATQQLGIHIDSRGRSRPLLRLRTLGTFEIWFEGTRVVNSRDLTPKPQQYVATLAAAPGMELSRETLQAALWPDGGQSTSKLYALRNRIKKVITTQYPKVDIESHFALRGSLARLEHVACDADSFCQLVRRGIAHWRSNQRWHAGNAFFQARQLWGGSFFPTAPATDPICEYRAELDRLNHQQVLLWAQILCEQGELDEAAEALTELFDTDATDTLVANRLYRLQQMRGDSVAAAKVFRQHQDALAQEGYPPEAIECLLEEASS